MDIPKHEEIRLPALKLLTEHDSLRLREFEQPLAEVMGLTVEQVELEYDSGNGRIFYDRISWALSYMNMAGLVQKPNRGVYQISGLGREHLASPESLDEFVAEKILQRKPNKRTNLVAASGSNPSTPQEELFESSMRIREAVYSELIDVILSKSPREFEKLVVMLLQKMGYGGEIEGAAQVTQYTNDQGIDGIIKEDVLGLGRVHIQAKRYARDNSIGREDIQKFVGAIAAEQSGKGVFITTSSYSKGAKEYVSTLGGTTSLVLIDGEQLAEYIYDYGLGMQVEQTIEIKKLDSDFWDSMED